MKKTALAILVVGAFATFGASQAADTAPARKVPPMATVPGAYAQKMDTVRVYTFVERINGTR